MTMSLSSMITLPSSSANGFYSTWRAYPEISSPTASESFSPPGSRPSSPSLMMTLPGGPANGFYSSWDQHADIVSSAGSGSLSFSQRRFSSPPFTIHQVLSQRASWPVSRPFPDKPREKLNPEQDPERKSRPTSTTTTMSFSYTVRSVNSRKSRMMVLYPRPVRPQRASCVGVIAESESAGLSTESLVPLSSRPVSLSILPLGNPKSITDKEAAEEVMATLSTLFDTSPENPLIIDRRLTTSWNSLAKINAYEKKNNRAPNFRATRTYADTLLCVHNDIIESGSVGEGYLTRPCIKLHEAFEDAYVLLSDPCVVPQVSAQVSTLDADLFRNFVVSIMQLISLIPALEVLVDSLAVLAVVKMPSPAHKADLDDDVIFNVPGWRQRKDSRPTLPSVAPAPGTPEAASEGALRLLLMTRHEELEWELRGLRFLIWRANPRAKVELGDIVKRVLPSHHAELMRSPVEDFVEHWQAAVVVPSGYGLDDKTLDGHDS